MFNYKPVFLVFIFLISFLVGSQTPKNIYMAKYQNLIVHVKHDATKIRLYSKLVKLLSNNKNVKEGIHFQESSLEYIEINGFDVWDQLKKKEKEIVILNAENKIKTLQFYISIGVGVLVLLLLIFVYNRFKSNKKSKEHLEELNKEKSHFFANISHEFRTPLTLIMGSIQKRLDNSDGKNVCDLHMALRNSKRLKVLIDQLLDLSKIEFKSMPLSIEKVDIQNFIKIIFSFFTTQAEEKNIEYTLEIKDTCAVGFIDPDKVEKIMVNLLSNAFKFTPNGGKIHLKAIINNDELYLSVKDTGVGLSEEEVKKVFNRFYQVDDSLTSNNEGSGIGLALSEELAEIHKGELGVVSSVGEGSEFILCIPINNKAFNKNDFKTDETSGKHGEVIKCEAVTAIFENKESIKPLGVGS